METNSMEQNNHLRFKMAIEKLNFKIPLTVNSLSSLALTVKCAIGAAIPFKRNDSIEFDDTKIFRKI